MFARSIVLAAALGASLGVLGCAQGAYRAAAPSVAVAPACGRADDVVAPPAFAGDSVSIGRPNAGALAHAVQMPAGPLWNVVAPPHAFATDETVAALVAAIEHVASRHPGGHPMHIGDMSREFGGTLFPHKSHQSGRDADVGYYYLEGTKGEWYQYANAHTLDRARTWAFVKALVVGSDLEYVFIDRGVQRLLREHALSIGEDPVWVDSLFEGPFPAIPFAKTPFPRNTRNREALIRHAAGHATHIHVRFFSPEAQARGRRAYRDLVAQNLLGPGYHQSKHLAVIGDDVRSLAQRYGMNPLAIVRANGLRSFELIPGRAYVVPRLGRLLPAPEVELPPRSVPPCGEGTSLTELVAAQSP